MVSFDTVSFDTDAHPKEKQMTINIIMNIFIFAFMITSHPTAVLHEDQSTFTIKTEEDFKLAPLYSSMQRQRLRR